MNEKKKDPRITINVVYDGDEKPFETTKKAPLRTVFKRALAEFGLQPADEENLGLFLDGNALDLAQSPEQLGLAAGVTLILQRRRQGGGVRG